MTRTITPATRLAGTLRLPGDKSISHRYALLTAVAEGTSRIDNYATGADCQSTLDCLAALGVPVRKTDSGVVIEGVGLDGLQAPARTLEAGNSGSTMRMLAGLLAPQRFSSEICGDGSLSRRPMRRVIEPLAQMGARIEAREDDFPPLRLTGRRLRGIDYALPVASAQVKTAILLAGLCAEGQTVVREPVRTRDHTELALAHLGAAIETRQRVIRLPPRPRLRGQDLVVPGDLSSAAFFLIAALLIPGSEVLIQGVGLNPTRSALLDLLVSMGAQLKILEVRERAGELAGDLLVRAAPIRGGVIQGPLTAALIDEIPVLAVLGAGSQDGLVVRDAAELRIKESDRIAAVTENLQRMGVAARALEDGLEIPGRAAGTRGFRAAELDCFGDHRIAMAFGVAALLADGPSTMREAESASVSFPEFYDTLERLRA